MKDFVVHFENVKKSYGSKPALQGLSLHIRKGELFALLGPNGAGKSTALSLLLGLRSADSGKVEILGGSPRDPMLRQKLGATPQELSFPALLTVRELLHYVQGHYRQKRSVDELVDWFQMQSFIDRRAGGLSGGEKRRVGLALALCGRPEVVVLDEPTTGMDVEARRGLWQIIQRLVMDGTTVVLTTHYLEEVEALASHVVVIDRGVALFDGTVGEIKSRVEIKKISLLSSAAASAFQSWPGVVKVGASADLYQILVKDSDRFVQQLIKENIPFRDLSIELASLEEAFLELREHS